MGVPAMAQGIRLCLPSHQPRVPSTPTMLLSIYIWILSCGKDENKQKKRPEWSEFFKKKVWRRHKERMSFSIIKRFLFVMKLWHLLLTDVAAVAVAVAINHSRNNLMMYFSHFLAFVLHTKTEEYIKLYLTS